MTEASFDGKGALVTGGGTGIGRAVALAFAARGAGVLVSGRRPEPLEETVELIRAAAARQPSSRAMSPTSVDVAAMVGAALERFGRLDLACNNAGIEGAAATIPDGDEEDFDRVLAINVKGVWLCMQHELRAMADRGTGAIVNASSVNAVRVSAGFSAYCASKSAVESLTVTASLECGPGIRVNALRAGAFDAPMLIRANTEEVLEEVRRAAPLVRIGEPAEAAEVVAWLCSDSASYVTGACIAADGGLSNPNRPPRASTSARTAPGSLRCSPRPAGRPASAKRESSGPAPIRSRKAAASWAAPAGRASTPRTISA